MDKLCIAYVVLSVPWLIILSLHMRDLRFLLGFGFRFPGTPSCHFMRWRK